MLTLWYNVSNLTKTGCERILKKNDLLGCKIIFLSHLIKRNREEEISKSTEGLTFLHFRIVKFIRHNDDLPIFQKDLEKEFNVRRSTMSGTLDLMESNALIERKAVSGDKRLKQICLTEKAIEISHKDEIDLTQFERKLAKGIDDGKMADLMEMLDILIGNMENYNGETKND